MTNHSEFETRFRLGGWHRWACLVYVVLVSAAANAAEKPNILFLLSDDHSYPFVGCYGNDNVRTPTLDRLAAEGMKFHRFFTAAPQCVPSRAALLTGRSPVAGPASWPAETFMMSNVSDAELDALEAALPNTSITHTTGVSTRLPRRLRAPTFRACD